jgi:hypothetical protein
MGGQTYSILSTAHEKKNNSSRWREREAGSVKKLEENRLPVIHPIPRSFSCGTCQWGETRLSHYNDFV